MEGGTLSEEVVVVNNLLDAAERCGRIVRKEEWTPRDLDCVARISRVAIPSARHLIAEGRGNSLKLREALFWLSRNLCAPEGRLQEIQDWFLGSGELVAVVYAAKDSLSEYRDAPSPPDSLYSVVLRGVQFVVNCVTQNSQCAALLLESSCSTFIQDAFSTGDLALSSAAVMCSVNASCSVHDGMVGPFALKHIRLTESFLTRRRILRQKETFPEVGKVGTEVFAKERNDLLLWISIYFENAFKEGFFPSLLNSVGDEDVYLVELFRLLSGFVLSNLESGDDLLDDESLAVVVSTALKVLLKENKGSGAVAELAEVLLHLLGDLSSRKVSSKGGNGYLSQSEMDQIGVLVIRLLRRLEKKWGRQTGRIPIGSVLVKSQEDASNEEFLCSPFDWRVIRSSVRILGNFSFANPHFQEVIFQERGVDLVLNTCVPDERAPMLREWGIFALRNLCEGNEKVQSLIRELQPVGIDTRDLERLGIREQGSNPPKCESLLDW